MTVAAIRPAAAGTWAVLRWEVGKLRAQRRVRLVLEISAVAPFLFVAALSVQSATPQDTLFGRWVHESGMAVPLVILGFAGQWALPLLVCVVAGDIFSSEDHLGTWKTVLTRAVSRSHLFGGKLLAIAGYLVSLLVVLAIAALAAGLLVGHEPLVGLSGQRVTAGPATAMVLTSWCSVLLPTAGFGSLAVLISVLTRNSVAGIGGPVVLGLVMQLLALVDLPQAVQTALLSTGMLAWHGLWTVPSFTGPLWESSIVAVVWIGMSIGVAWVTFARRDVVLR